jgi:hypothetical protein
VARDSQAEQRVFGQPDYRRGGAPQQQPDTARVLQHHVHNFCYAFPDQDGGETEHPFIPIATGRWSLAGRLT